MYIWSEELSSSPTGPYTCNVEHVRLSFLPAKKCAVHNTVYLRDTHKYDYDFIITLRLVGNIKILYKFPGPDLPRDRTHQHQRQL